MAEAQGGVLMFNLDGNHTQPARYIHALLKNSRLPFEPDSPDSLTCVVYRKDPLDKYLFTTAVAGVRQLEPLFGPLVHDDRRDPTLSRKTTANPLGFAVRENTVWQWQFPDPPAGGGSSEAHRAWQMHLSGRGNLARDEWIDRFKRDLLPSLADVLGRPTGSRADEPLFPDLWFHERLARDRLREEFRRVVAGQPAPEEKLTVALAEVVASLLGGSPFEGLAPSGLGIYLNTGTTWDLIDPSKKSGLPDAFTIERDSPEKDLSALQWVIQSTRPVLLRSPLSAVWRSRVERSLEMMRVGQDGACPDSACIVPLLDLWQPRRLADPWWPRTIGLLVLVHTGSQLAPAHLFLLSRLAESISGYVGALQPYRGFPWLKQAAFGRGPAKEVVWAGERPASAPIVEHFARVLTPRSGSVKVSQLAPGYSSAEVYRVEVNDGKRLEIPRVLKIGPVEVLTRELKNYHEFVHNKRVGGAGRVDTARVWRGDGGEERAAVLYTLVGAGEDARPWSVWARGAAREHVDGALEMLFEQLTCWHYPQESDNLSSVALLIRKPFVENGELRPYLVEAVDPTLAEVDGYLRALCGGENPYEQAKTHTCVAHRDLHSNNVFAVLSKEKGVRGVAVIDWGSVRDHEHPLTDISKLMADLLYKVRWPKGADFEDEREWAFGVVRDWGRRLGCQPDWSLALTHQIAKMLFYTSDKGETPYFTPEARRQAWQDLRALPLPGS